MKNNTLIQKEEIEEEWIIIERYITYHVSHTFAPLEEIPHYIVKNTKTGDIKKI